MDFAYQLYNCLKTDYFNFNLVFILARSQGKKNDSELTDKSDSCMFIRVLCKRGNNKAHRSRMLSKRGNFGDKNGRKKKKQQYLSTGMSAQCGTVFKVNVFRHEHKIEIE